MNWDQQHRLREERRSRPHFVYLVELPRRRWLKIGMTRHLQSRVEAIADQEGTEARLVCAFRVRSWERARHGERRLCEGFARFRVRGNEWFRDRREIRQFFDDIEAEFRQRGDSMECVRP